MMKKYLLLSLVLFSCNIVFAKKVKFAVDMFGQTLEPSGMHVFGDFQDEAGFPNGDWQSNTTSLTQEGSSDIYSIVVDIPAFTKYEYKFLNGDMSYHAEFVPLESRVDIFFDDNRWLYIDSLADDTTNIGAILFAANAPAGLTLLRFVVDMQNETVSSDGVHVAGTFQSWDPAATRLYSFGNNIYEYIAYVTTGTWNYKFYNGNTVATAENIPAACSVFSNREVQVSADIVLSTVCFSSCSSCTTSGINEAEQLNTIRLLPNPTSSFSVLQMNDNNARTITLSDVTGRIVRKYENYLSSSLRIEKENLENGIYFVNVEHENKLSASAKLVIE